MSKLKTPLLSMGARGSLGDSITFQGRGQDTIVREKPEPAYRRTLPQQYQRWLYEDYAYLWSQQTAATKQQYASLGVRHHLTGFQYWMKVMLSTLPDIAAMWHLDEKVGNIAYDYSKNANHGTIFGASPAAGVIDGARYFDGQNDWINCGSPLSLRPDIFTLECFYRYHSGTYNHLALLNTSWYCYIAPTYTAGKAIIYLSPGNYRYFLHSPVNINDGKTHHLAIRITGNSRLDIINASLLADGIPLTPSSYSTATDPLAKNWFSIGRYVSTYSNFTIDHLILYTRLLDPTEIKRHSERRYP